MYNVLGTTEKTGCHKVMVIVFVVVCVVVLGGGGQGGIRASANLKRKIV